MRRSGRGGKAVNQYIPFSWRTGEAVQAGLEGAPVGEVAVHEGDEAGAMGPFQDMRAISCTTMYSRHSRGFWASSLFSRTVRRRELQLPQSVFILR